MTQYIFYINNMANLKINYISSSYYLQIFNIDKVWVKKREQTLSSCRCSLGPIPDKSNICGELYAPADIMTSLRA